jgi:acylphosphatase
MKRRVWFKAIGRVQGVAYRASAREQARLLGVHGWIRNLSNGRAVEGEAEGEASAVDAFVAWCGKGPLGAKVEHLNVEDSTLGGELQPFEIR